MTKTIKTQYPCTNCDKETKFELVPKNESFDIRGEPITVNVEYMKCTNCGDEIYDPAINHDPFELAYQEYRRIHGYLQPTEITNWRKERGLTQTEVAAVLGTGVATVNRYENGSLQSESHENLLRLAMDSSNLLKLIEKSEGVFPEERKKKIVDTLRKSKEILCTFEDSIIINFGDDENIFNGFQKLNLSKLFNAVLFFARDGGVFKSKLNKLLFYSDFKHFKEYTLSITGLKYAHLPYGPVPDNYAIYYATMASKDLIKFIEEPFNNYIGEKIISSREPDLNVFSASELRVLASVSERCKEYTAAKIQELSHEETGYQQTSDGEIISYEYAGKLRN